MKLFVTDLDGTLLSEITHASTQNIEALRELKRHGYTLVIASGRPLDSIQEMNFMELKPYIISLNGAIVYDPSGKVLMKKTFTKEQLEKLLTYCKSEQLITLLYSDQRMYRMLPNNAFRQAYAIAKTKHSTEEELLDHLEEMVENIYNIKKFDETVWERIISNQEYICKIEINGFDEAAFEKLENTFQNDVHVTGSWPTNREITIQGVNKGNALRMLCETLTIPLSHTIAIGDNNNDIEMLETAGYAIAMGNASNSIKQFCDYVSEDFQQDGVAKAIAYLLQKK